MKNARNYADLRRGVWFGEWWIWSTLTGSELAGAEEDAGEVEAPARDDSGRPPASAGERRTPQGPLTAGNAAGARCAGWRGAELWRTRGRRGRR